MRDVAWTREGELEIAEGVYEVNASSYPAWLVVRDVEARGVTIAYMAWRKHRSLDDARRVVEEAARSFVPTATLADYLAIARERPARERQARLATLQQALAARGVRLAIDGGPVEHDGRLYELHTAARLGVTFTALHPLGALPLAAGYRHLRPTTPNRVGNWPDVLWFARADSGWTRHALDRDFAISARMQDAVAARHRDDAGRAHFYAADVALLDGSGGEVASLDWLDDASRRMTALFAAGKLVR
jgi:hypothetical protein